MDALAKGSPLLFACIKSLAAMACYYCSSSALILYNRWLFAESDTFHFPLTATVVHMLINRLFSYAMCHKMGWSGLPDPVYWRCLLPLGLLAGFDIGATNISFRYASIPLIEILKSCSPVFCVVTTLYLGTDVWSWKLMAVVLTFVAGAVITCYGEIQYRLFAIFLLLGSGMASGVRIALGAYVFSDKKVPVMEVLYYTTGATCYILVPCAMMMEFGPIYTALHATSWTIFVETWMLVSVGGILAIFLHISELLVQYTTQPTTAQFLSFGKVLLITYASMILYHDTLGVQKAIGMVLVLTGGVSYTWLRIQQHKDRDRKTGYDKVAAEDEEDCSLTAVDTDAENSDHSDIVKGIVASPKERANRATQEIVSDSIEMT